MPQAPGNDLDLGLLAGRNATLSFPRTERDKHLYVCGGTGTGKSKFLEHLLRQDIRNWHKSKCGLMLLDPHGLLYDSLIEWLAWNERILDVPIIPIDLRQDDWVVSYNLLRQRELADPAVLVDNITDAMAYVWGQGGTNQTPLFARWAGNVIGALYEKKLTLVEAEHLIDRVAKQTRYAMTADLKDKPTRQDWQFADTLNAKDFETQIGSTVMDPDEIKHELYSTKVMSYREELKEVIGESVSRGRSHGTQQGHAGGTGIGGTKGFFDGQETLETSESWSEFESESGSESDSWSESETHSRSLVPTLIPVFGKELAHIQFRSLEEQLFRAMAVLFDQKQRQGVARLVGMNAPVSLYTPTIDKMPSSEDRRKRFLDRCYEKLPFALPSGKAQKQLADRAEEFGEQVLAQFTSEPATAKRKLRPKT